MSLPLLKTCLCGLAALAMAGCAGKETVVEYRAFHKHCARNGVADAFPLGDSIRIDNSSRIYDGVFTLNGARFTAYFREPFALTDSVVYHPDPMPQGGPFPDCVIDPAHRPSLEPIPFAISDSLVSHWTGGAGADAKWGYRYRILCGADLEEGEIHLFRSHHQQSDPIGN